MLFLIFIVRYIVPVLKIHKYNLTSFNTFSITATKRICKFNSASGFKYMLWNESTKKHFLPRKATFDLVATIHKGC